MLARNVGSVENNLPGATQMGPPKQELLCQLSPAPAKKLLRGTIFAVPGGGTPVAT